MIYQAGGIVKLIARHLRVSGHGNARDLQLFNRLLKPQFFSQFKNTAEGWMPMRELLEVVSYPPGGFSFPKRNH